uniref:RRM domain-containing protein n=1 Tax=Lactuca sativa TaxID=4236 RepID=A0A9R1X2X2_LACSA|nr:hypothetical protein LSAT_V11C700368660 [Lactuca sativa]
MNKQLHFLIQLLDFVDSYTIASAADPVSRTKIYLKTIRDRGRGRAHGGGGGRGQGRSFGGGRPTGPPRRGPLVSFRRPKMSTWQQGLFEESLKAVGFDNGARLNVSNLDIGVTNEDFRELFSEIGELKRYAIHYDKNGRPSLRCCLLEEVNKTEPSTNQTYEAFLYFVDNGRFSVDGVLFDNPVTPSAAFRKGKPLIISFEGAIGEFPGCSDSTYRGLCKQQ